MASTDKENKKQEEEPEVEAIGTPVDCFKSKASCKLCCCALNNYWKALIGVVIIFTYLLLGGLFFLLVEGPAEQETIADIQERRAVLNASFQEQQDNFTQLLIASGLSAEQAQNLTTNLANLAVQLAEVNTVLPAEIDPIWDYASSVFFASTVITTIGYGTIAPATAGGQILFIFYCLVGIPLALIFLSTIGSILSDWLDATLDPLLKKCTKSPVVQRAIGTTITVLITLVFFIIIPSAIFFAVEAPNDWTYLNSIYYCFVTLTTVGFGDFVPGIEGSAISDNPGLVGLYRIITAIWVWLGLALVATLISEAQELIEAIGKAIHKRGKKMRTKYSMQRDETPTEELTNVASKGTPNPAAQEEVTPGGEEQATEEV